MLRSLVIVTLLASLGANAWFMAISANLPVLYNRVARTTDSSPSAKAQTPPVAPAAASCNVALKTSDDYRTLRARLEKDGLPPRVAKVILAVLLEHDFASRKATQLTDIDAYWLPDPPARNRNAQVEYALQEQKLELARELGIDAVLNDPWADLNGTVRFGKLSPEKKARLQHIYEDYVDLRAESEEAPQQNATNRAADEALLARELRADIERTLTPAELRDFDYRNSPAAHGLRDRFGQFAATEAEFVALFPQVEAIFNGGKYPAGDPDRRAVVEEQLEAALRQTLGEARYQEMREANNWPLQGARRFLAEANLPLGLAGDLVAMDKEFSARRAQLWQDRDLSANQRNRHVQALEQEKRERLRPLLGPQAEAYAKGDGDMLSMCGGAFGNRRLL